MIQVICIKSPNRLTVSGDEEGMYSRVTPESKIYIFPVTCRAVDPSRRISLRRCCSYIIMLLCRHSFASCVGTSHLKRIHVALV